jgi:cytochrome c oxidase subunit 2
MIPPSVPAQPRIARRTLLSGVLGAAALLLVAGARPSRAEEPVRVVEISAKRFRFEPAEVTLRRGEKVKLVLRSDDVVHGFFSRPLGIDTEIHPGTPTEVVVTPRTAGRFLTICDHFCGAGHGNMTMTFVVE